MFTSNLNDGGAVGNEGSPRRSSRPPTPSARRPSDQPPGGSDPVGRIRQLLEQVRALDPSPYVVGTTRQGLADRIATPMRQLVDQALSLAQEMEPAVEDAPSEADLDLAFGPSTEKHLQPAGCGTSTGSCNGVAAYCFALQHELRPVAEALTRCGADHEEILVACDRAGRKLRRSLSALASALARAEGRPSNLPESWVDRAASAVAVRTLYAKFRRALASGPDGTDPAQVARALRRAATALAVLCGDEDFGEVRIQDRLLLRSLQQRILAWGRSPHVQEGLRLYGDIWAAGELLRAINMRQELRAHDAELVEGVCASLETEAQNEDALKEILGRLRALRGLDEELDDVLWRAYGGTPVRELDGPLRQAMTRLQATLCGAGVTPDR